MGKVSGKHKGIAITAAVLLLSSALLYLMLAVSTYSNSLKDSNAQLVQIEELNSQFDSVAYGLRVIELGEAMNISYAGSNITFTENTTRLLNYSNDVRRWAVFAGAFAPANVSINASDATRPKLNLRGRGIEVDNAVGRITYTPQNSQASAGNVSGYDVSIWVSRPTPSLNWTSMQNVSPSSIDAMYFHVGLQGTNGTVSDTRYLNKSRFSELRMQDSGNASIIVVQADSPAALKIFYNADIYIKTVLQLSSSGGAIELGNSALNVSVGNAHKIGSVIVGEN
ncbi:Uncharacterised protein [Candidatus Anstonella stagnisolia]|nr:Uncharacterised protein [Candidatus Anstonella stagnisolia]